MSINSEASKQEEHEWIQLPTGSAISQEGSYRRRRNPYYVDGDTVHVRTFKKDGSPAYVFMIDLEDLDKVILYGRWYVKKNPEGMLVGNNYYGGVYLHKFLLGCDKTMEVDHVNRNPLDNRKVNLRVCTHQENCLNRGTKGKCEHKGIHIVRVNSDGQQMWASAATYKGRTYYLGYFYDPLEAARAYDRKVIELHGEFACTNFPRSDYEKESL